MKRKGMPAITVMLLIVGALIVLVLVSAVIFPDQAGALFDNVFEFSGDEINETNEEIVPNKCRSTCFFECQGPGDVDDSIEVEVNNETFVCSNVMPSDWSCTCP